MRGQPKPGFARLTEYDSELVLRRALTAVGAVTLFALLDFIALREWGIFLLLAVVGFASYLFGVWALVWATLPAVVWGFMRLGDPMEDPDASFGAVILVVLALPTLVVGAIGLLVRRLVGRRTPNTSL